MEKTSKTTYLAWFNRMVKTKYMVARGDTYRTKLVYQEFLADFENDHEHELPGKITKSGNPILW